MLKIHTDFAALRREGTTPATKSATDAEAPADRAEVDQAVLTATHRAIAEANEAARTNRLRDMSQAREISATLRQAIANLHADANPHEGLTPERIQSLLQ